MTTFKTIFTAIGLIAASATPAFAGDVTLTLEGVQAKPGELYVSMQTQEQFMQPRGSYGEIVKVPTAGKQTITMKDVRPGDYAISVWHDVNSDHQFNRAANGYPLDGWTMINAEALRATPKFDQVKFSVPADGKALTLKMYYAQ
jgi:uncharacterized protein (DUF2141 family)